MISLASYPWQDNLNLVEDFLIESPISNLPKMTIFYIAKHDENIVMNLHPGYLPRMKW